MRSLAVLVLAIGSVILSGCDVGDMVDSRVLSSVQEYFPLADIHKPQPDILAVNTHVGNVTEKFGAKVFQGMLAENATQLQMGFRLVGYTRLIVSFEDFSCFWDIRRNAQFGCSDRPASIGSQVRVYQVYENQDSGMTPLLR